MTPSRASVHQVALERLPARGVAPATLAHGTVARQLQQRLGNQGTQRLIAAAVQRAADLRITAPGDPAELEAQANGRRIANMDAPEQTLVGRHPIGIARDALPRAEDGEPHASASLAQRLKATQSAGSPLPATVRDFMAPRFGADFRQVRIHTDMQAAAMSSELHARAFTYGQHIYFGTGQFAPDTHAGRELIAHELTHTLQQGERIGRDDGGGLPSLGDVASEVLDFGESAGWALLDQVAPGAAPIIRKGPQGIVDWLKERANMAVEGVLSGLMAPVHAITGAAEQLSAHCAPMLAALQVAAAQIAKNDCTPLREAAEKIEKTAERLITPIVEKLQPVVARVKGFLDGVWTTFGAPIWDWIKQYAGAQWDLIKLIGGQIQAAANWIWDKTASVRALASKAWTWLKNKLGIGEGSEGRDGLLQWAQAKLEAAWNAIKLKLEPFKRELTVIASVVGAVVLAISPAGPVAAIGAAVVGAVQGLRWIAANWGKGNIVVTARVYLEKTLIPALQGAATRLGAAVAGVFGTLTGALGRLAAGMARLATAIDGGVFSLAAKAVQWLAAQAAALATWATAQPGELKAWLQQALGKLKSFMGRVQTLLAKVGKVIADIRGLGLLIAEAAWNAVPACIRDPIIDFLGPIILRQIEIFQELVRDDDAWQKTKASVGRIIKLVFKDGDLMGAVRATFNLILRVFNVPAELLVTIARKALAAWDVVSKKPLQFIKNTVRALGHGFRLLGANFGTHLRFGLEGWLFGELKEKNISPPKSWTSPGDVFYFVLEVLGLSVNHMWELVKQKFDPDRVEAVKKRIGQAAKVLDWINKAVDTTKTPAENARSMIGQAKDFAVGILGDIATWVAGRVAQELAIMATAAAASAGLSEVLDIARRIYKAIVTATRWLRKILDMVNQTLDNVVAIAGGAVEQVGVTFEKILHMGMPVVVGFLADQVGLGGVGAALREATDKLRARVDKAILWLIDKVKAGIGALIKLGKAGVAALANWWNVSEPVNGSDGAAHKLYFAGKGMQAVLTVASTPAPVTAFLAGIAPLVAASTDPQAKRAYPDAVKLCNQIDAMRTELEKPDNPRQPAAIDKLNNAMTRLAKLLEPLTPLGFPPRPPGPLPAVNDLVKLILLSGQIARVTAIDNGPLGFTMFRYSILRVPENRMATGVGALSASVYRTDFVKYEGDLRTLYMGPTPSKDDSVGAAVKTRMQAQKKFDAAKQLAFSARENIWHPLANCDMGHIIDAVIWWNSNGRLTGAQSPIVLAFMRDPDNYEFEPSALNRARGAALRATYLPPLV